MSLEGMMLYFEKRDWTETLMGMMAMVSPPSAIFGSITFEKKQDTCKAPVDTETETAHY